MEHRTCQEGQFHVVRKFRSYVWHCLQKGIQVRNPILQGEALTIRKGECSDIERRIIGATVISSNSKVQHLRNWLYRAVNLSSTATYVMSLSFTRSRPRSNFIRFVSHSTRELRPSSLLDSSHLESDQDIAIDSRASNFSKGQHCSSPRLSP